MSEIILKRHKTNKNNCELLIQYILLLIFFSNNFILISPSDRKKEQY